MEDHTKHYLISGRVQGVGFRRFVHMEARARKLSGWVRNLADGRVESLVCGPASSMGEFEAALQKGPPQAKVEAIEVRKVEASVKLGHEFIVQEDGDHPWFDRH